MAFNSTEPKTDSSAEGSVPSDWQPAAVNVKHLSNVYVARGDHTLEERIKFGARLSTGTQHLVEFTLGEHKRRAIVVVSRRGVVKYLAMPHQGQMYSSWQRVTGNICKSIGGVFVWPGRDPEHMSMYEGEVVASIPCPVNK